MSEILYRKTIINILRWLGIIPASGIAYILGYMILQYPEDLFSIDKEGEGIAKYIFPVIGSIIGGSISVTVGSFVAPQNHKSVGVILLVIMSIINGIYSYISYTKSDNFGFVISLFTILGSIIGYLNLDSDLEKLSE